MSITVLIADDEVHMRDLVARALEPLEDVGVKFLFASSGEESLETALNFQPQLVVLDIMMPDLSGIEVCKELKKRQLPIYILMLTAMGQTMDKLDALDENKKNFHKDNVTLLHNAPSRRKFNT